MYGYLEGLSDTDAIYYCPSCGDEVTEAFADGTCKCGNCGLRFGVIEVEEDEGEKDE